ncbi:hypothetical protein [Myxococcus phage Mx4 ts27htf-1hrm-1]|nr:hypothetical protein Mx4_p91 [Myxococcus phage Mx4]WNM70428.1 hypothetical protein [Myxococcus phage Mx4 ts27htf-1hrm-1]
MAEGLTLAESANRQRWCMAEVPAGQEAWPKNASWHPYQGRCKRRGKTKVGGEWRCAKHLPKSEEG